LSERASNKVRSNLPKLPNATFMVVIHWVSNGKDMVQALKQFQASYTNVTLWEERIDSIDKKKGKREPFIATSKFKCTLDH